MRNSVRVTVALALVVGVNSLAVNVGAQVFHVFPGATVINKDIAAVGATVGFGDHLTRMLGYGRFNVSPVSDLGLEVVMDNTSGRWRVGAGADFRYEIVPTNTELPFDLSVGAGLGFESGADFTNVDVPVGGMLSRPFALRNGRTLLPFGGFYVVYTNISGDFIDVGELEAELRSGVAYEFSRAAQAFVTLSVGGRDTLFVVGLNANL